MVPKLVAEDIPLLRSLLTDVFPGVKYTSAEMTALKAELKKVCAEMHLVYGEGLDLGAQWVEKVRMVYSLKSYTRIPMFANECTSGSYLIDVRVKLVP